MNAPEGLSECVWRLIGKINEIRGEGTFQESVRVVFLLQRDGVPASSSAEEEKREQNNQNKGNLGRSQRRHTGHLADRAGKPAQSTA